MALVPTTQQDDKGAAALHKVDPLARTIVNTDLADTAANGFGVPEIACGHAVDPRNDACPRPCISQAAKPASKGRVLLNFDHCCGRCFARFSRWRCRCERSIARWPQRRSLLAGRGPRAKVIGAFINTCLVASSRRDSIPIQPRSIRRTFFEVSPTRCFKSIIIFGGYCWITSRPATICSTVVIIQQHCSAAPPERARHDARRSAACSPFATSAPRCPWRSRSRRRSVRASSQLLAPENRPRSPSRAENRIPTSALRTSARVSLLRYRCAVLSRR